MRTLTEPFKINQMNAALIGGEQFASHKTEPSLTSVGFAP